MCSLPSLTAMRLLSWVHPCLFSSPLFTWLSFMMDSKFQWYVYTFCKDWCWSWNSNTLATWWEELTHFKRPWCWERLRAGGEGDDRGWDGWWHHPLNGHGFGWTLGVGDGQGSLACCSPWGHKESEMTDWTELNWIMCIQDPIFSNKMLAFGFWTLCLIYVFLSIFSIEFYP